MVKFSFGAPVGKDAFYNREEEVRKLVGRLETIQEDLRNDIAIIGPRRVGKSSLTKKLLEELAKKGIIGVKVDCEGLNPVRFLREYGNAIISEEAKRHGLVENLQSTLKQGISSVVFSLSEVLGRVRAIEVGSPLVEFIALRIELEKTAEKELKGEKLFNFFSRTMEFPEKLGKKYVVVFDEFQETSKYKIAERGDFHALFRRAIQYHKNTGYVYTGSSVGMMREIFGNLDNPLAGNADILQVEPFTAQTSNDFVKKGLENYGKQIDQDALDLIVQKTGGFPSYLNWIGLKFTETPIKSINRQQASETLEKMLDLSSPIYQAISKQLVKLGPKTMQVVKVIALGSNDAVTIRQETNAENVHVYLKRLQSYGLVEKQNEKYALIDPVMEEGFKKGAF